MEWGLVVRWAVAFGLLWTGGLPIAAALFPRFPDRGASLAIPTALVVAVLPAYYVGHVAYGTPALVAGVVVLVAVAALSARFGDGIDRRGAAESLLVFALGAAVMLWLRAYDPTIHAAGGEKFLHFGLLKSVGRAETLPPADQWFAGEPIAYYYAIPVAVDLLATATATEARFAYNLAYGGFFGALVASAYGLAGAVADGRGRSRIAGGALGAGFVCVAGFLVTPVRILFGALPRDLALEYGRAVFGAIRHYDYAEAIATQGDPATWGWFYDRYVVEGALTEFPLYAYVKGDMHGHNVLLAWLVLAAALAYAYYRTPAGERTRRRLLVFLAFPVLGGFHGVANTWSMPSVAGLAWLALTFAPARPATLLPAALADRIRRPDLGPVLAEGVRTATAAGLAGIVAALSYALASPFLLFHTPQNEGVGLLPPRTELAGTVLLYGGFLALFAGYLFTRRRVSILRRPGAGALAAGGVTLGALVVLATDLDAIVLTLPLVLAGWYLLWRDRGEPTGDSEGAGTSIEDAETPAERAGDSVESARTPVEDGAGRDGGEPGRSVGFETVLLVGGVGLLLSMELVYAKVYPYDVPRWNTTFKVAIQAWTLCGLAAGPVVVGLLADALAGRSIGADTGRSVEADASRSVASRSRSIASRALDSRSRAVLARARSIAIVAALAVLLVSSGAFAGLATDEYYEADVRDHPDRNPTMDGLATHETFRPAEMAAIEWLDERDGRTTLLSTPGDAAYSFESEAATFTGHSTVVGWTQHVDIHRGEGTAAGRAEAVHAVYVGPENEATATLDEYDVGYVYVGPNERETYEGEADASIEEIRAFDEREWASVAFSNDAVTIYEIDREALEAAAPSERVDE